MRAVIQRVNEAQVSVDNKIVGKISAGLFILLGIEENDVGGDAKLLSEKISKLRIMSDDDNKMNLSILDKKSEVLVVSQFTLHANTNKGNRPSFIKAADPKHAKKLYESFISNLKHENLTVKSGQFGAYMEIKTSLDGPVTILLDTKSI